MIPADGGGEYTSWRAALLRDDATMEDAVRVLDKAGLQIVLVVNELNELLGTVTDGDVRRGLLRGLPMNVPVVTIAHQSPLVVPPQLGREAVLQLMQANKVHHLPVVDERRRVIGLHLWDNLAAPSARPNAMVIMAGGKGTRLRPHTESCPKPLLPVGDKPMLEHIIDRARAEGFKQFVLSVHYLGHMIEEYFGDGNQWGVRIDYLREPSPLGTAGALGLMQPRPDAPFVVTNGDVLTDIRYGDMLDFHLRQGAVATMAVRQHEWQHPFGVVQTHGVDIIGFEEKPVSISHVNAGIYILDPAALDVLAPNENCDMPDLFARLRSRLERTIVYPMHEQWLDVGRIDDFELAQVNSLNKQSDC